MQQISQLQPPQIDVISIQSQVVYGSVGNGIAYRTLLKKGWKCCRCPACCSVAPLLRCAQRRRDLRRVVRRFSGGFAGPRRDESHPGGDCRLSGQCRPMPYSGYLVTARARDQSADKDLYRSGDGRLRRRVYVDKRIVDCYRSPSCNWPMA